MTTVDSQLRQQLARYSAGEDRARVFRDLVLADIRQLGEGAVVVDIGCGKGFDGDTAMQQSLAAAAGKYIGIEPDTSCSVSTVSELHHCLFEDAPIAPASVHVAFSVFVQEHLSCPQRFWDKLWEILVPGGVYWGFTVDSRHFFSAASTLLERLHLKDWYLDRLWGRRGLTRYNNYPTHYLANSPAGVRRYTRRFRARAFASIHRVGQLKNYFPARLRRLANLLDYLTVSMNMPGSILVVRLQK